MSSEYELEGGVLVVGLILSLPFARQPQLE